MATHLAQPLTTADDQPDEKQDVASRLIDIVHDLALELHPHLQRSMVVKLDSDLDRELGFDSLGRAELLLRLDRAFKVGLPESLIGEAVTPREFLAAILSASPNARAAQSVKSVEPIRLPASAAPVEAETLIEVLAAQVDSHAERPHIWLCGNESSEQRITYEALDRRARAVARGLIDRGVAPGDRAAIMLATEADYFYAFFGVLMAGGVPVPIYPPVRRAQVEDHLRRQAGILRNAEATILITSKETRHVGTLLHGLAPSVRFVETVAELSAGGTLEQPLPASGADTALIQYTSGSTGDPKGVVLSHTKLLTNIRAIGEILQAESSDVFVSWLPLYHDMGLIGAWFGTLYFGAPLVIMSPLAFLADPGRWLWTIHHHRATLSATPNFAFELCLKSIRDEDIEGLDLSSLRMVLNGAEPIIPSTISRFTRRFEPYGFRPNALAPVYGLAECAVGLAFPPAGRAPIIDGVKRDALAKHRRAEPAAADDPNCLEFVACGQPLPGHEVRIIDAAGHELPERHEGRLQFRGPSATEGYFRNPEKTRLLFDGDWLDSGDRSYIANGDIYITGRIKDIIIRAGRNIYPHELEESIGNIEGVRKGCVAAFASPDIQTGTERLIVIAETRLTDAREHERLRQAIMQTTSALLDLPPDDVVIAPPHAVPKTSSGKLQRSSARKLYEAGAIEKKGAALWWQIARLSLSGAVTRLRRGSAIIGDVAYAGWFYAVLCVIGLLLWPLVVLLPGRRQKSAALRQAARLFFLLTGVSIEADGQERPVLSQAIMVANHSSYLDGLVLMAVVPGQAAFVAKEELNRQLVTGPFLRALGAIFVRRSEPMAGLEDTTATRMAVEAGELVVFFPEGTLMRMPGLLPFRMSAFLVAAQTGVPVIPVTILGTRSILRGGQWLPHRGPVRVQIGAPLHADGTDFEAATRLRDAARAEILAACGEPDLIRETSTPSP